MNLSQGAFFGGVAHARHGDPKTSKDAAASVSNLTQVKERILAVLIPGPAHDEEIIRRYRGYYPDDMTTDQSIRSRRAELSNPRWPEPRRVEWTGDHNRTVTGARSKVWRLVV